MIDWIDLLLTRLRYWVYTAKIYTVLFIWQRIRLAQLRRKFRKQIRKIKKH